MANDITGRIKLDAKSAAKELEAIDKQSKETGESVEGIGTKGQVMARILSESADAVEQDLADAKRMADLLGEALGPELTAKLKTDGQLLNIVDDLRRVGLTADDVEADVDQLAASIKRLDDSATSIRNVESEMGRIRNAQDRVTEGGNMNRSVIANFAGNATQELPGVANAFGPLNMAMSQAVEYAAEGNINIGKMVAAGLAMGGVAVAIGVVTSQLAEHKREVEASRKRVDEWAKAIRGGKDDLADLAREALKIDLSVFGDTKEITDELAALGMTADQFFSLVEGGQPAIDAWAKEMQKAGFEVMDYKSALLNGSTEQINFSTVLGAAMSATNEYARAQELAAVQAKVFGTATDEAGGSVTRLGKTATEMYGEYAKAGREAMVDVEEAADDVTESVEDIRDELAGLRQDIANDQSAIDLADQFDQFRTSAVDAYTATAEGAEDAEEKQRDYQSELNATKQAVIDYATEVLGLPAERVTEFVAMIDQGQADQVEAILNSIARNRFALITPGTGGPAKFADGTYNAGGGMSVINDGNGPELVTLPGGSKVMTAANTENYLDQMGGGAAPTVVNNKTINLNQYIEMSSADPGDVLYEAARRARYME